MYIDSINKNNTDCSLSAFGNVLICSNAISADKTVTFPVGYRVEDDSNLSFKILFTNGHNCIDDSTHMTLSNGSNAYPIVVNKDGTLIPLPIHTMDEGGVTVYKSLQPNTILEMYFDSTYNNNTGAFVVIGNPIVLSSETDGYTIYANGQKIVNNSIYSTTERIIGTWVDGKPIYALTVLVSSPSSSATGNELITIPNIDKPIKCEVINYTDKNNKLRIPFTGDDIDWRVSTGFNGTKFIYELGSSVRTYDTPISNLYVEVWYTKN